MQSLYDDIVTALQENTFTIPNVTTKEPFDESGKTYPCLVVHEIVNVAQNHGTVNGETRTVLAYQIDVYTQNCTDSNDIVLSKSAAGRRLVSEVNTVLDALCKFTRRTVQTEAVSTDVLRKILRGDCVLESSGYSYRP